MKTSAEIDSSLAETQTKQRILQARRLHLADGMSSVRMLLTGLVIGAVLGGGAVLAFGDEPSLTIRNGVLRGWAVTKDNETLVCTDPMIFIRGKQIECE